MRAPVAHRPLLASRGILAPPEGRAPIVTPPLPAPPVTTPPHEEPVRRTLRAAIVALPFLLSAVLPVRGASPVLTEGFESGIGAWAVTTTGTGLARATAAAARYGTRGLLLQASAADEAWVTRALTERLRRTVVTLSVRRERPAGGTLLALRDGAEVRAALVVDADGKLRVTAAGDERTRVLQRIPVDRWVTLTLTLDPAEDRVGLALGSGKPAWATLPGGAVEAIRLGGPGSGLRALALDRLVVTGDPVATPSPSPTPEPTPDPVARYRFTGRGSDHGVGLSQAGAYGRAEAGQLYPEILAHYYPGTTLEVRPGSADRIVRVLVLDNEPVSAQRPLIVCGVGGPWTIAGSELTFPRQACAAFTPGTPAEVVVRSETDEELYRGEGTDVMIEPAGPTTLLRVPARSEDRLRGSLQVRMMPAKADVIDHLPVDLYLRAVVPREMYTEAHIEALRTQAVAARSYVIHQLKGPEVHWDVHDDSRNQVYGGVGSETARTTLAVTSTIGEVLVYDDRVANAIYHAQGGWATEDARNVFTSWTGAVGVDIPYLRGSPDLDPDGNPYDEGGPYDSWGTDGFTWAELSRITQRDARTDVGPLKDLLLLEKNRGVSGRLTRVTLVGTDGTRKTVAGWYFKSVFNRHTTSDRLLRSTLFFLTPIPTATAAPAREVR